MNTKVIANDDTGFWEIHDEAGFICKLESESTARLLAKAPELLSVLEKLADYVFEFEGKQNICTSVWMDAREAIAKAKGEIK
jgi:hypothetical protein